MSYQVILKSYSLRSEFYKSQLVTIRNISLAISNNPYFFNNLDKAIDTYSNYDRVSLADDFNAEISENVMDTFLHQHNLKKPCERSNLIQKFK